MSLDPKRLGIEYNKYCYDRQASRAHVTAGLILKDPARAEQIIQGRFWEKVKKGNRDECWEWQGSLMNYKRRNQAYGLTTYYGKIRYTHRLSYQFAFGPIPDGMEVMHSCDNPKCVNPAHLRVGTQLENMQDCSKKGRMRRPKRAAAFKEAVV